MRQSMTMTTTITDAPIHQPAAFLLSSVSFALTSIGLDISWHYVALAIGGSLSGSIVLAYYRREKSKYEQLYKIFASSIAGLIVGSAFIRFREVEDLSYIAFTFFICSMLILIAIRTIISLSENNAQSVTTTLIKRIFNIDIENNTTLPRRARRKRVIEAATETEEK